MILQAEESDNMALFRFFHLNHQLAETMTKAVRILAALVLLICFSENASAQEAVPEVRNILFIGDSMTGWLAERLNAYGNANDFKVAADIWDGSTIRKWGTGSSRITQLVKTHKPDAVFISLGMNELYEANPARRLQSSLDKILGAVGDIPVVWIGPLSWPGKNFGGGMDKWLGAQLGKGHYFVSTRLEIPRQSKTNPHPTRHGANEWMDAVVKWLATDGAISLPSETFPAKNTVLRPKVFNYRRITAR